MAKLTAQDFKIRCSAINEIMAGECGMTAVNIRDLLALQKKDEEYKAKNKSLAKGDQDKLNELLKKSKLEPELPQGAKTYVKKWVKENIIYERRISYSNKYTRKGHANEDAGRDLVAKYLGLGMILDGNKNGRKYGSHIEGICDGELPLFILDIKNSYTFETFPIFDKFLPKKDYESQIKGYCHLYNKPFGIVAYVLTDFSEDDIMSECSRQVRERGLDEITGSLYDEIKALMTYSDLDDRVRVKLFRVDADPDFIKEVEKRVELCRKYAQTLIDDFKLQLKSQKNILDLKT